MAIETFNRVEEKYVVTENLYKRIVEEFGDKMVCDDYSKDGKFYQIANIYYDTADSSLIRTSLQKPKYKEKIRLRAYGVPGMDTKVFLELKKKFNGVVNKRRSRLKLSEAYDFTASHEMPEKQEYMNMQVLKELKYAFDIYDALPMVYIAYKRRAFFGADNPDLRITFDKEIVTRREDVGLENGVFGNLLMPDNYMIMEVKYTNRMPLWLIQILREYNIKKQSFSKYGTEFKTYLQSCVPQRENEIRLPLIPLASDVVEKRSVAFAKNDNKNGNKNVYELNRTKDRSFVTEGKYA